MDLIGSERGIAATQVVSFIVTFLVIWLGGRIFVISVLGRVMNRRGLDSHAKVPLLKIPRFAIGFVGIAVAFGVAE